MGWIHRYDLKDFATLALKGVSFFTLLTNNNVAISFLIVKIYGLRLVLSLSLFSMK